MAPPDFHASSGSRDTPPASAARRVRRQRFGKFTVWGGLLVLLAIVLHRPLLHAATRRVLQRIAQRSGLELNLRVSGSIWTGICFSQIELAPSAGNHPVLETLRCAQLELEYSPLRMLWSSPAESITGYRVRGVDLRLHSLRPGSRNTEPENTPGDWMQTVEKILALPALYADTVHLRDVSIQIADGIPFKHLIGMEFGAFCDRPGRAGFESLTFRPAPPGGDTKSAVGPFWAATEYAQRNLVLTDLPLTPRMRIARFAFDASERGQGRSRIELQLAADAGRLRAGLFAQKPGFALGEKVRSRARWRVEIDGAAFPLGALMEPFGFHPGTLPDISWVESHVDGDPREPLSWQGQVDLRTEQSLPRGAALVSEAHATLQGGTLFLNRGEAVSEHTRAKLTGSMRLPPAWQRWKDMDASLHGEAHCRNLREWMPLPDAPAGVAHDSRGSCSAQGNLIIREGSLHADIHAGAAGMVLAQGTLGAVSASLEAHLPLEGLRDAAVTQKMLSARAAVQLEHGRLEHSGVALSVERVSLAGSTSGGTLTLQSAEAQSGPNRVQLEGVWEPEAAARRVAQFRNVHARLSCPSLERSGLHLGGYLLAGSLDVQAQGDWHADAGEGSFQARGQRLRWGDWELPALSCAASAHDGRLVLDILRAQLKADGAVSLAGEMDLRGTQPFHAAARIQIPQLSAVAPALWQLGWEGAASGSVEVTWKGAGKRIPREISGQWTAEGRDVEFKSLKLKRVQCSGSHHPERIEATKLEISTGETVVHAPMLWESEGLHLPQIRVEQGGKEVLHGEFHLPVQLSPGGIPGGPDAALRGHLRAQNFNLGTLWKNAPARPPISGVLDLELTVEGTPDAPRIALEGGGVGLQLPAFPEFPRCTLRLTASHQESVLNTELTLHSALGGPAQLRARIPVSIQNLLRKDTWPSLPLDAHVDWSRMKLGVLPALWPALKRVEGEATLRGHIQGPWNALRGSGDLKMDCATVHFRNDRIPALSDLRLAVHAEEGGLRIQTLRADLGGGSLEIRGDARGANWSNPTLDLQVSAHQVLVQRTPQLSLRLDGNLRITGPLQSAQVTGRVTPVKSMVRREMEVLPLTALTQTTGGYKRPPGKPWFTFPKEPLANWRFDVGIISRPEDPILIRGNRLRGTALSDIRFQGTGKTPTLEGSYQTDNLVASLPFARLEVSRGRLWYHAADPFSAQVDLSAETEVRSHRIRLYLFGTPESPAITVSSDPPLPERDALTLLTTGVLPGAVGSESTQGVAARAASLLLQEFSNKFLENSSGTREGFSALRRFNLEMGAINNRTGTQETRLTYRIQDNVFMIGEVGANGDFATRLRYILRFR